MYFFSRWLPCERLYFQWCQNFYEITSEFYITNAAFFLRFLNPKLCQIQIQLQKRLFPRKKKLNFIQLRIEKIQNNLLCKLYRIQMGLHNNFGFIIYCAFLARFFFANLLKKSHIFSYTTWAMRSSENGSCIQYVAQSSLAGMPDT